MRRSDLCHLISFNRYYIMSSHIFFFSCHHCCCCCMAAKREKSTAQKQRQDNTRQWAKIIFARYFLSVSICESDVVMHAKRALLNWNELNCIALCCAVLSCTLPVPKRTKRLIQPARSVVYDAYYTQLTMEKNWNCKIKKWQPCIYMLNIPFYECE